MSACSELLDESCERTLTLLVERFGQDGWLVRRSAGTPQRWIVVCHNPDESGRRLASALIDSAGDENWWVVAIPTPADADGACSALHFVADALEQGKLACLNGISVPHFYLFGCDEGAYAAEAFTCAFPDRVIRLVLLPGRALGARLQSQQAEGWEADGRRLVRTPLLVVLPGQLSGDHSVGADSVQSDWLLAIDGWLRQIRRSAYRRGIQPDCRVFALSRRVALRTTQLLQEPQLFAEVGAFYRGNHGVAAGAAAVSTTAGATLQFIL